MNIANQVRNILHLMTSRPTPRQRREFAEALEAEATYQRRLADAEQHEAARPPAERMVQPTGAGRGGGRPSTPFVVVEWRDASDRQVRELRIKLSRAAYYGLGSPPRLDVQRIEGRLALVVTHGDAGYAVVASMSGIWINANGARDLVSLGGGRYAVEMQQSLLWILERLQ